MAPLVRPCVRAIAERMWLQKCWYVGFLYHDAHTAADSFKVTGTGLWIQRILLKLPCGVLRLASEAMEAKINSR